MWIFDGFEFPCQLDNSFYHDYQAATMNNVITE